MPDKDQKKPEEKPALTIEGRVEGKEEKPAPKDNLVVTQHKVRIGGKEIKYTVTAGTMVLKEETADREKESEGGEAAGAGLLYRIHQRWQWFQSD